MTKRQRTLRHAIWRTASTVLVLWTALCAACWIAQ
jgi:hypothetical protein